MSLIDTVAISNSLAAKNRVLIAAIRLQCPVYLFHLSMKEQDRDPFYAVDWAIIHYIAQQSTPDIDYLSALIGMNTNLIRWRIKLLLDESSLAQNLNLSYVITTKGERKFFSDVKPEITRNRTVPFDGVTLEFLDDRIYQESRITLLPNKPETNPHMPLLGKEDPHVKELLSKLESLTDKEKYNLDSSSHDFNLLDIEARSIDEVFLVFSYDTIEMRWVRETMYRNDSVEFASLKGLLNRYGFFMTKNRVICNDGYAPENDSISTFHSSEIIKFICNRYSTTQTGVIDYTFISKPLPESYYPLTINITEGLFDASGNKRQLLNDANRGEFMVGIPGGGIFIVKVINSISRYVETFKAISQWISEHGGIDIDFIKSFYGENVNWRKDFLLLQCYDELEEIDNKLYIRE